MSDELIRQMVEYIESVVRYAEPWAKQHDEYYKQIDKNWTAETDVQVLLREGRELLERVKQTV